MATWVIDLTRPQEEIFHEMSETTRYEVRRAEEKDGFLLEASWQPGAGEIAAFAGFYAPLARRKKLDPISPGYLGLLSGSGHLYFSRASAPGGKILAWHAHYVCGGRARLLHSASSPDAGQHSLIARANRWLHWRDFLAFRERGIPLYDFGGIYTGNTDQALLKINHFKEMFGGRREDAVSYALPRTARGRAYLLLRRLLR
ncbi:MAG: GNAT family N-acetyltransferase [Bdellovibrionales bacterium]|nr:GNAT family N-acetyltransferase [Bdellovibrionales bacterium]